MINKSTQRIFFNLSIHIYIYSIYNIFYACWCATTTKWISSFSRLALNFSFAAANTNLALCDDRKYCAVVRAPAASIYLVDGQHGSAHSRARPFAGWMCSWWCPNLWNYLLYLILSYHPICEKAKSIKRFQLNGGRWKDKSNFVLTIIGASGYSSLLIIKGITSSTLQTVWVLSPSTISKHLFSPPRYCRFLNVCLWKSRV